MADYRYDEDTHSYYINDVPVPSVTQIVDVITATERPPAVSPMVSQAMRRGTAVHGYCECLDYGIEPDEIDIEPELAGYVRSWLDFKRDFRPEWRFIEKALYSEESGFAGRLDRFGVIDDIPYIADIKTTTSFDRISKIALACQLYGYWRLLKENGYDVMTARCIGVQLHSNGKYTVHYYKNIQDDYGISAYKLFECGLYIKKGIMA